MSNGIQTSTTVKGRFNEQTTWDNIKEYVEGILDNPIILEVSTHENTDKSKIYIYNFNTHKIDFKSLKRFVQRHPYDNVFIIPHSMSAAWAFMLKFIEESNKLEMNKAVYLNYRVSKYLPVFSPNKSNNIFKLIEG